jgi:hypothetical protein
MPQLRISALLVLTSFIGLFVLGARIHAGPPLICHGIDVPEGKSLPWGADTFTKSSSYNASNVVHDALELLAPQTPVLTRMETLRRATLYIDRNKSQADELLGHLMARALDAEAAGKPESLAWFDAGYIVQCYRQTGTPRSFGPAVTKGEGASSIEGYSWVARAIALQGAKVDPALEVAAALVTADSRAPEHEQHMKNAAAAGFGKNSPEEKKLMDWLQQIHGLTPAFSR